MTALTPSSVLSHHAHRIMQAAPREWEAFVEVFDKYATEVTVAVTAADVNEILVAQGRARAFLHLLKLFRTCHLPPPTQQPPQP